MNRTLLISLLLPVLAAAETPRYNAQDVSLRIRQQLEGRGVDLEDVARAARERRQALRATTGKNAARESTAGDAREASLNNQIRPIFNRMVEVYQELGVLGQAPRLVIDENPTINAYASNGREVRVFLALSELIQDSPSELAFVIAHELGHIVQQRTGQLLFVTDNAEFDADVWGVLTVLVAGYDPYGGSGTLSKLSMVVGDVGLSRQFEDQIGDDAHKSFVTRIEVMYDALRAVCNANESLRSACNDFRDAVHPHFPANAVL